MNAEQAKQALKQGKKVREKSWNKDYYFKQEGDYLIDEEGVDYDFSVFIDNTYEWEIVE